jgi:long-chain acyl-CoA synthetase
MNHLGDLLIKASHVYPEKVALCADNSIDKQYTYQEWYLTSRFVSRKLLKQNIENKNIIIHANNSTDYVVTILSLLFINCTIIPVSITCSNKELEFILQNSDQAMIITDEKINDKYKEVYQNYSTIDLDELVSEKINDSVENSLSSFTSSKINPAFIIFSSGSTGEMKGIICPHESILFAIRSINQVIENSDKDKLLCALPFSFDYGLYQIFIALESFSTIFVQSSMFNPLEIPNIIDKNNITGFPAMPMWLSILEETKRLNKDKLQNLRYITSTGDVLKRNTIFAIRENLPNVSLFPMYGLTECKRVSILPAHKVESHAESVGFPLKDTKVRIVDEKGYDVPDGQIGELVVSGPHLMDGYYKDKILTKDRYRYNKELKITELYTGDLFKKDKEGYLYFISRTQLFIKRRGQRISPFSIEDEISDIAEIENSIVIPVRFKNEEHVVCFFRSTSLKSSKEFSNLIKQRLIPLYRPDFVFKYEGQYPTNNNGKINRKKLIDEAISKIKSI